MKYQGKDYEGKSPWELLPYGYQGPDYSLKHLLQTIEKYIGDGNKVMVEITKGARKGTIGELVFPSFDPDELYGHRYRPGLGGERRNCKVAEWHLKFDDRSNIIKIPRDRWDYKWNGVLRFGRTETLWVYKTTERPKEELPELFDHFGTKLEVGQVAIFITGTGTNQFLRLGKISRWSAKGTIWANTMRTRENHPKDSEVMVQGSVNVVVLDGDVRAKAMMARLSIE